MIQQSSPLRYALAFAAAVFITFCAPLAGVYSTPDDWYEALAKPTWNPPGWIFGPVWTSLYLMMATAAWLVWKRDGWGIPLWLYLAQLALNAAWTPIFFGAHLLGWAFVEISIMWIAILSTILAFQRVHRAAALLLLPYLAWVTFAAFLNFTLWRMNPG
jgi:tryptophan-rich sensory protein